MSKYCIKCGNELKDDQTFCIKCGAKVGEETTNAVTEDKKVEKKKSSNGEYLIGISFFIALFKILGPFIMGLILILSIPFAMDGAFDDGGNFLIEIYEFLANGLYLQVASIIPLIIGLIKYPKNKAFKILVPVFIIGWILLYFLSVFLNDYFDFLPYTF